MTLTHSLCSRLREYKDTVGLFIFTLDLVTRNCPIIAAVENLPYDSLYLVPCSAALGGVIVVASNSLLHIAQTARRAIMPISGWSSRVSDLPIPTLTGDDLKRDMKMEGSCAAFVDDKTLFLFSRDGTVYPVEVVAEGRTVSHLSIGAPIARTTVPTVVRGLAGEHLLVGSMLGPSVLLKAAKVEEDIPIEETSTGAPTAVVDTNDNMDLDDDDGTVSLSLVSILLVNIR